MPIASLCQLIRNREGGVAILFALVLVVVASLIGSAVDYSSASKTQAKLQAITDAAALAAVTPAVLSQSDQQSAAAAQNAFIAGMSTLPGVTYKPSNLNITVSDAGLNRTVTVSYTATTQNIFPTAQGSTATITASSQAVSMNPPNIDFYMLLDNSPSMAIAATTAGINTMVANTSKQGGCAFACHESNPSADNLGNPNGEDNYTLAKNLGVVTRIQNLASATQQLAKTAASVEQTCNCTYRMALYTFNNSGTNTVASLTSNLTSIQTMAAGIDVLEVYDNNWLTKSNNNSDEDTDFETAMYDINNIMPAPGNGSATNSPQEVLFIVSDGVDDSNVKGQRNQALFDTTWCTTVKNRGIRIAVLYTAYLPLTTNSWYNTYIAPFQSKIAGNMQSCASPGLYYMVTTDGDISAAMQGLFSEAVSTAHLTH